jgi:hypothetical protein
MKEGSIGFSILFMIAILFLAIWSLIEQIEENKREQQHVDPLSFVSGDRLQV